MNLGFIYFCYFVCGVLLTMAAMGLGVTFVMPSPDRWNRRFFIALFTSLALCISSMAADLVVYDDPSMAIAERILCFLEYFSITAPMPLFTVYLLHCCGEEWRKSALFCNVIALYGVSLLLLGIAQFTTSLYYVTPDNQFIRGPWFALLMAPAIAIMLLNLAGVVRRRRALTDKYYAAFLIHLVPLTAAMIYHTAVFDELVVALGLAFSILSMFGVVLYDQIDQYIRQQWEIAHQRASIMVLQMRPHFIYNTMMGIYYLCAQDHKKAQQVTMAFTDYLRKNFTAIASEDTIPFTNELEHTRAYLAVEQAQFEDNLLVRWDTPHTHFRLPPLTLQPIVENAVKHGMDPDSAPLRITITTRATEAGSEIIVEDNGPGFAPADDAEPHIALTNIQQRLEMMCGGKLTIMPRAEGGTVVKVTIPERSEARDRRKA